MIDHFGKPVRVGYASHELIWIRAAMRLPRDERTEAYQDIAQLTGRTEFAIREKAKELRARAREDFAKLMAACPPRRPLVPQRKHFRRPPVLKSELRQPTLKQLMGCR